MSKKKWQLRGKQKQRQHVRPSYDHQHLEQRGQRSCLHTVDNRLDHMTGVRREGGLGVRERRTEDDSWTFRAGTEDQTVIYSSIYFPKLWIIQEFSDLTLSKDCCHVGLYRRMTEHLHLLNFKGSNYCFFFLLSFITAEVRLWVK